MNVKLGILLLATALGACGGSGDTVTTASISSASGNPPALQKSVFDTQLQAIQDANGVESNLSDRATTMQKRLHTVHESDFEG